MSKDPSGETQGEFIMRMWKSERETYGPSGASPGQLVDYFLQYRPDAIGLESDGTLNILFSDNSWISVTGVIRDVMEEDPA